MKDYPHLAGPEIHVDVVKGSTLDESITDAIRMSMHTGMIVHVAHNARLTLTVDPAKLVGLVRASASDAP